MTAANGKARACPNPTKKRYATRQAAESAAHGAQIRIADPLYPYLCCCTWWHLSKYPTNADTANLPRTA